jgi:Predicted membrane protein
VTVFAVSLLCLPGCRKKKPALPPPQAQAPTTTGQPAPPNISPETSPSTATQPPLPEASSTLPKPLPPKPKNRHHNGATNAKKQQPTPKPAAPAETAKASPPLNNEAVGQISPDVPSSAQNSTVQSTNQLLDSTEQNLRGINRSLSNDEQNILSQIRSYVAESRAALKDQDFERAHNLAIKAHLYSEGLLKQ